ncbi:hypothetical protein [Kitasatospora aureofaciens]|uniref:hypothetical protein n=1 Tax=Kitasatospora aureofaciens TaxID=1894 RepID=UPI0036F4A4C1
MTVARITLVEGDITEQRVDAVVNAADSSLLGGGSLRAAAEPGAPGGFHRGVTGRQRARDIR